MSKCWYCNNELTTGDNPKHFGICNKCYDEMFKSVDTIIRNLTDKIAELQEQLHSQPKEIIEKIKNICSIEDKCEDGSFVLGINEKDLDTILKEYDN